MDRFVIKTVKLKNEYMNRDIKFRMWCRDGEWNEDGERRKFCMIEAEDLMPYGSEPLLKDALEDIEDEQYVMQFTGLTDKNGKEIYEGDRIITRWIDLVAGKDEEKQVTINSIFDYKLLEAITKSDEIEVIGNIYENPELLNK